MANKEKLRKFGRLSSGDRRMLVSAFFLLFVIHLSVRVLSFSHVRGLIEMLLKKGSSSGIEFEETQSIPLVAWAVSSASQNMPFKTNCLSQALATHVLLHWKRIPSELHIGVTHGEMRNFEAHAWVVCNGLVVMGYLDDLDRFKPMTQLNGKIF